jgi:hypothetical protein
VGNAMMLDDERGNWEGKAFHLVTARNEKMLQEGAKYGRESNWKEHEGEDCREG